MPDNAITDRYLKSIGDPGVTDRAAELGDTSYHGKSLSRPAFLDHRERAEVERDLVHLHRALAALPDRLFGGDLGAFARAAGMDDVQVGAVLRTQGTPLSRLSRADLYHDGDAFRIMELNMGSTVGGLDNAQLNRFFLGHPAVAEFVHANGLSYVDTMVELAEMLKSEGTLRSGDERPYIAAVDWPASYETLEPQLRESAAMLGALGVEIEPCHLGQLEFRGGRVWLHGRPVDVVYRVFMIEDLLDPRGPELIDPVLKAAERGEVRIFTPLDAELYGSKAALAMLSDEAHRHLYDPDELTSLDRILPWTRMVRDEPVTVDGGSVDLLEYAMAGREDLVLKPAMLHGGIGIVLGWRSTPEEWRQAVRQVMGGPYVLQRRIRAVPERYPAEGLLLLKWNIFLVDRGYGGAMVGGTTDLTGSVLNSAGGAVLGCCFHEESP